ncbi:hypothetical protein [Nitrosopumilus spindle-shaped virus]|uniref:Uncharacterized protein n=1 Tax=Nitrosopumilus spindle-shaped virus TaxID=2508184 RepID=A0A514K3A2_9VIRU|nr:hypothetical protein [Nitrosopumilus spindle-shaped virus]
MENPVYIKTDEVHTQLNNLVVKKDSLVSREMELKLSLDNIKNDLAETKKNLKNTIKQIDSHKIVLDGMIHGCLECGYVLDRLEDIKPTPLQQTPQNKPSPI